MSSDTPPLSEEERRKAHFTKTKKAVLKLALDNGGSCAMEEMHNFCESKLFVAHQQFSLLLEGCVADGLISIDADNLVTLTDVGKGFAAGA